jgi:predicted dehydrogenase
LAATLDVALLGCGGMGRTLGAALGKVPRARLVSAWDVAPEAAQAAGEALGVPWTADLGRVLDDPAVGAVIVATPNFTHADVVVQAAAHGKHVFCEKPMALSVADCDRMIAAAAEAGIHLCVGHVLRYLPVFDRIRALIAEGAIGTPFAMRTSRLGGWGEVAPWRRRRATSGGPLFEINAHELDFMCCVLGEPEVVFATGSQAVVRDTDFEDTAFVTVRFAGGGHGVLHASVAAAGGGYTGTIQGTGGTLHYTNWPSAIELRRFDGTRQSIPQDEMQAPDAHARELSHLVEAALDGTPPAISGRDGRAAVAMAEAATASMERGEAVRILPPP